MLLAGEVARLTVASRVAESNPRLAMRLAPGSPAAVASVAMAEVGQAAGRGSELGQTTLARFEALADVAPLRPEPFLVQAALAERAGQLARANSLLEEARRRDPRSIAALYLLADVSVRQNNIIEALKNIAVLARLVPGATVQLLPSLAQFAREPGAQEQLSTLLKANPALKPTLLDTLAQDWRNARLVLTLAGPDVRSLDDASKIWKSHLVEAFIDKGDYRKAYNVWRIFAGLPSGSSPLLFNGEFRNTSAPPPFDWTYTSSSGGVAEPSDGSLQVLYYGREDSILASQLLLLPAGTYRFNAPASGSAAAGALAWTVSCAGSGKTLMQLEVGSSSTDQFTVPADCEAQALALNGRSLEVPKDSDVKVERVALERVAG